MRVTSTKMGADYSLGMNLGSHASSLTGAQEGSEEQGQQDHTTVPHHAQRSFGLAGPQGSSSLYAGTQWVFPGKPQHPNHVPSASIHCGSSFHHPPPQALVHSPAG